MEEVTNYTIRDTNLILVEALEKLPRAQRVIADPRTVYSNSGYFMDIGHDAVTRRAAEILRKRNGWTRADAVEMAFDSLLSAGNGRVWQRVGEVAILKHEGVARAFCLRREE